MKKIYFLFLAVAAAANLQAQAIPAATLDRATLAATFLEGAQLIEFSTAHTFQTYAYFDPNQLSSSSSQFVNGSAYYNWQSVSIRGFTDNRYLLQVLQRVEEEGWELTHTNFASTPPNYDYAVSATRSLIYHLARPARSIEVITTINGQLSNRSEEYRVRILQQGQPQWLEVDRKAPDGRWQNLVSTSSLFPTATVGAPLVYQMGFNDRFLEIKGPLSAEGITAQMIYRFGLVSGQFTLIEVVKIVGEPCGSIERASYRPVVGNFKIEPGQEICSITEGNRLSFDPPSFNRIAERMEELSLGNFQIGKNRIRVSRNQGDFIF